MLQFITRYFSSLGSLLLAPPRLFWRAVRYVFPRQDVTALSSGGHVDYYHRPTWYRFSKFCIVILLIVWSAWSSFVFAFHRPMLEMRTRQLAEVRAQYSQHMSDLNVYFRRFSELQRDMNALQDQIIASGNRSETEQRALLQRRINLWAQLEMIATRLNTMFTQEGISPEFTTYSALAVEFELTREENRMLRAHNILLEENMIIIADANTQIVERVTTMSRSYTDELQRNMRRVQATLTSLGLSERQIATKALRFSDSVVGAAINPLTFNANADPKYTALAEKLELWQGLARARAILPIGTPVQNPRITSPFGMRSDPFTGRQTMHRGVDFAGPIGTPLLSPAPGRVIFVGERGAYGKTVEVDHGLGFTTLYAHLSRFSVERGDIVHARQVVGLAGNTGRSTAPHLHYEIRFNNRPFNPYNFIRSIRADVHTEE